MSVQADRRGEVIVDASSPQPPESPFTGGPQVDEMIEWGNIIRALRSDWKLMLSVVVLVTLSGGMYAFFCPQWYKADALIAPVDNSQSGVKAGQLGALSGIAGLAGISLPGDNNKEIAIASLSSRVLIESMIGDEDLLPVLFADKWDAERHAWKSAYVAKPPTLLDGYTYFVKKIFKAEEDKKRGLITITVEWKSPERAAHWANELIKRANDGLRQQVLNESEHNLSYLQQQAAQTSIVELKQAIYALMDTELRKAMMAKGEDQYAFRVVDPAVIPERRSWPKRSLIVMVSFLAGFVFAASLVLLKNLRKLAIVRP